MPTTARSYVTAGVAMMGAGVIFATPITAQQLDLRTASFDVNLVAAAQSCGPGNSSALCAGPALASAPSFTPAADSTNMFNIPANLFIALANTPYNFFTALGDGNVQLGSEPDGGSSFQPTYEGITLTQPNGNVVGLGADLKYGGSWWVYSPTNILGTDTADVPRYQALANVLIPFPELSVPMGNMFAAIAASQLPMDSGCTGTGPGACDDPNAILSKMFDLRHVAALFSPDGYTYPTTKEAISCSADGQCYVKDPDGQEVPWSGETVKLDPTTPFTNFYNSLTETPDFSKIKPVTPKLVMASLTSLGTGLNAAFNPFVLGTQCAICAPFVPNPENKPIPGPVFEDPNPNSTPTENAVTPQTTLATAATAEETAKKAEAATVTEAPAAEDDSAASTGPKHRKPTATSEAVKQVRDSINASFSKLTDGFKKKPDSNSTESSDSSDSNSTESSDSSAKKTTESSDSSAKKSSDSGSSAKKSSDSDSGGGSSN